MNVLSFARDEVLCVEIPGSSSPTKLLIPIASFFWDWCGPSDHVRFHQSGAHFTGFFYILLDVYNPYAVLALWGGIVASKTAKAISLHNEA